MNRNFTIITCANAETLDITGDKALEFTDAFAGILKEFESALFDATFKKGFKIDYKINDNFRDYNGGFHYRNSGLISDHFFYVSGTEEVEEGEGWEEVEIEDLTKEEKTALNTLAEKWHALIGPYQV